MFKFRSWVGRRPFYVKRLKDRLCRCGKTAPSCITFLNLLSGITAFYAVLMGSLTVAALFLLIAVLCDMLDGAVARKFGLESRIGKELDSLVDAISFCAIPALILLIYGDFFLVKVIAVLLYIWCGLLRLARFNTYTSIEKSPFFTGIPTTMAAFCIALALLPVGLLPLRIAPFSCRMLSFIFIFLALSMISPIKISRYIALKYRFCAFFIALLMPRFTLYFLLALLLVTFLFSLVRVHTRKKVIKSLIH